MAWLCTLSSGEAAAASRDLAESVSDSKPSSWKKINQWFFFQLKTHIPLLICLYGETGRRGGGRGVVVLAYITALVVFLTWFDNYFRLPSWWRWREGSSRWTPGCTSARPGPATTYIQGISEKCTGHFKFGCHIIFWSIYLSISCHKSGLISLSSIHRIHKTKKYSYVLKFYYKYKYV